MEDVCVELLSSGVCCFHCYCFEVGLLRAGSFEIVCAEVDVCVVSGMIVGEVVRAIVGYCCCVVVIFRSG